MRYAGDRLKYTKVKPKRLGNFITISKQEFKDFIKNQEPIVKRGFDLKLSKEDLVTLIKSKQPIQRKGYNIMMEGTDDPCWKGYKQIGMKKKNRKEVPNCVPESYDIWSDDLKVGYTMEGLLEAEYQGRKVKLGKPMRGDIKKFKVYVKNPKGNVIKVNFGHGGTSAKRKTMRIRKSNPAARRSFRARHKCDSPGPRHKARYWSCRKW
jgi:hypothetical protein